MARKNGNNNHIISGHTERALVIGLTAGLHTVAIDPTLSDVCDTLGTVYRFWRFTKLKMTLYPMASSNNNIIAQYVAGGGSTTAGAADGQQESKHVVVMTNTTAVPQSFVLNHGDLITNQPWFITEVDATDSYLDVAGNIFFEGNGTESIQVKFDIDYEFKYAKHDELSLARLADRYERAKALEYKDSRATVNKAARSQTRDKIRRA